MDGPTFQQHETTQNEVKAMLGNEKHEALGEKWLGFLNALA